jgi:hypothetical protein
MDSDNRNIRSALGSTKRGGNYEAISERDEEQPDLVATGRTRHGGRYAHDARSVITGEDGEAIANNIVIIGNPDNTVESGSSGYNHVSWAAQRGAPSRGLSRNAKSPSLDVDFLVEPPSPTLESNVYSTSIIPTVSLSFYAKS